MSRIEEVEAGGDHVWVRGRARDVGDAQPDPHADCSAE
jgi:hypothetical protein